jgi:hypothetical protein
MGNCGTPKLTGGPALQVGSQLWGVSAAGQGASIGMHGNQGSTEWEGQ